MNGLQREQFELATHYEGELQFWKERCAQGDALLLDESRRLGWCDAALNRAMRYVRAHQAVLDARNWNALRAANEELTQAEQRMIEHGDIPERAV